MDGCGEFSKSKHAWKDVLIITFEAGLSFVVCVKDGGICGMTGKNYIEENGFRNWEAECQELKLYGYF